MNKNSNKTILFKQREEHHISKYRFKTNKDGKIDFKVIPYPKYKKVLKKGRKLVKLKNISIILVIILIAFLYFSLTNNRLSYLIEKKEGSTVSTSSQSIVSNDEFNTYSEVIKNNIFLLMPLTSKHNINTELMHKNGSYIYAHGYI
ncbi:hypothetical protein, partial [Romboutsia sp. 13368]|uniref:hypothetical protein n=1 Tax=Romboutsia sp. 13368 TaxID=2708053 RepID=UPI0025E0FF10